MTAPDVLHVVERGDHSWVASKTELKARGVRQEETDGGILKGITDSLP